MSDDRLLDEHVLRRALRLDADEVPPRIEPAVVMAAARATAARPREIALAAAVAFVGGWAWSEAFRAVVGGALGVDALDGLIQIATALALRLAPLIETSAQPVVPIAILTAAIVAALYEQRGRTHVASS
jgi:hypothetical protein